MALTLGKLGGYAVYITGPDAIGQGVKVGGKVVCFDFDERFGPLVVDRDGEPIDRQPSNEKAKFWPPFEAWLAGYWKAKGDGSLDAYLKANSGTIERRELKYPGRSHPNHSPDAASPADRQGPGPGKRQETSANPTHRADQ